MIFESVLAAAVSFIVGGVLFTIKRVCNRMKGVEKRFSKLEIRQAVLYTRINGIKEDTKEIKRLVLELIRVHNGK